MDGSNYSLQYYQGEHEDDYSLKKDSQVCLFHNGILKMTYEVDEEDSGIGDFTRFENGRVAFVQSFDDILDKHNFNRIVNHARGERMEIYSYETGKLIYHGEFNDRREREGRGIEYDGKSDRMLFEGIWKENKLVEIIRKIEGNIMTEFKRNGDNTVVSSRIPVFVGEFVYDKEKEAFIRNGRGYWIDEETRIAYRECEWKNGVKVSERDLYDGWYTRSTRPKPLPIFEPAPNPSHATIKVDVNEVLKLNDVSFQVTDLTISSNCCNDLNALDLGRFEWLRSIEIGDDCFGLVKTFKMDGLNRLITLKIGKNSFTQHKNSVGNDKSKSFHIMNCGLLESVEIDDYSFSDFAGQFALSHLPQLRSIQIGTIGNNSYNFRYCSFVIRGIDVILNIVMNRSSKSTIHYIR